MAWTAPRTWNPGETVTATQLNQHIRDNLILLKTNINDSGVLKTAEYMDATPRASSSTTETDASTFTLPAGTLATNGMCLRLTAWGKGGSSGTFTFKFYWNGASFHTGTVTAVSGIWVAEAVIMRTGAATQSAYAWSGANAAGLNTATPAALPQNATVWDSGAPMNATLSGTVAIKTTLTASATTLTQLGFVVEGPVTST